MKTKCVYITITTPKSFKKLMDKYAEKEYMKRSEFIRMAVIKYIQLLKRREKMVDKMLG